MEINELLSDAERKIGYTFRDRRYLKTALTHSSYLNEHREVGECNERLEFLGDSVLSLICSEHLYKTKPEDEGELTKTKALLVCEEALSSFARELNLGQNLLLGKGEEMAHAEQRPSLLCDEIEAVLGAIYLDGGYEPAKAFILPLLVKGERKFIPHDYKTHLQEVVQKNKGEILKYVIVGQSGPEHDKRFLCHLYLNSNRFAQGSGKSKKAAEQDAARDALILFGEIEDRTEDSER